MVDDKSAIKSQVLREENAELRRKHQADLAAWQQEREHLHKCAITSQTRLRNELEEAKFHQKAAEERVRLAIGELEEQRGLVIRLQRIEWERGEENAELRRKHQADLAAWQ